GGRHFLPAPSEEAPRKEAPASLEKLALPGGGLLLAAAAAAAIMGPLPDSDTATSARRRAPSLPPAFSEDSMPNRCFASCVVLVGLLVGALPDIASAENWPCWRGPRGDGTSLETGIPTKWDGTTGDNIVWKTAIPGRGHASPIVWGDRIFVVSCLEKEKD